jgi:hypothetical protein
MAGARQAVGGTRIRRCQSTTGSPKNRSSILIIALPFALTKRRIAYEIFLSEARRYCARRTAIAKEPPSANVRGFFWRFVVVPVGAENAR